jgi:hypothetical protein
MPGARLGALLIAAAALCGCAAPRGTVAFEVPAARYDEALDAVRSTLRDARFQVDRVDAESGVVSTFPKPTAGLASPWDTEQADLASEVGDLVNQHERVARVEFSGPGRDLRTADGMLSARVEVVVYRVRRGNWRIETESISRSTHARDALSASRGQAGTFRQAVRRDDVLAAALADRIRSRLGLPAAADAPAP